MIPEGWGHEGPDPSVGIFGDFYWHDACTTSNDMESTEADYTDKITSYNGEGYNRFADVTATMTCRACGATYSWTFNEWTPDYSVEEPE